MSERIKIEGFLVIQQADLELKKINILIGTQASGKSIIAKLCYFFRKISDHFLTGIRSQQTKRELDKHILEDFERRFPRYAWEGSVFSIHYEIDDLFITIKGVKNAKGKTTVSLAYTGVLLKLFNSKKRLYKQQTDPRQSLNDARIMYNEVIESLIESEHVRFFSYSVFIPASRSFFANLQKNIFTFMSSNIDIDPFLKDFGSLYESTKKLSKHTSFRNGRSRRSSLTALLDPSISAVINGKYEYEDEQDWIVSRENRVNMVHASSGQQEALPMLLVLSVWPLIHLNKEGMIFIEEPEAHLFPTAQSRIIAMLSHLYQELNVGFFLTSHSPYVLSALNNHILAGEAQAAGKLTSEEYTKMNGSGVPIRFEDVAAYTISKGTAESLADAEYRMIGGDMLDDVSEHFGEVANSLLELIA
ncbi:MAG: ATP-binding protein [Candidatus Electrothrix sp. AX5]|nr:ATP-binding protein [Candidatus Electrothrix sp. AX5]